MAKLRNAADFLRADFPRTLYPLNTNYIAVDKAAAEIDQYIKDKILNEDEKNDNFLSQSRVYAAKSRWHLRRTLKLDPVAEYFIYDLVYRNRASFRKLDNPHRRRFGYRFSDGELLSPSASYRAFKAQITKAAKANKYYANFDIASYFNSIYHHDLAAWLNEKFSNQADISAANQFFRQINSGRTIDCLPQGIYPCKILGNHFLDYVHKNAQIKSEVLLRFMDDFYLFDDNIENVISDFSLVQQLLGQKALTVNPVKTKFGPAEARNISKQVEKVKIDLLKMRRSVIEVSGEEIELEDESVTLTSGQIKYLIGLLRHDDIEEEDAELVLSVMKGHERAVLPHLENLMVRFPNLAKNIYYFCLGVSNRSKVLAAIQSAISRPNITDYQLFWFAKLCEDKLLGTKEVGTILINILNHPTASEITKAKVLEIPDDSFGLGEIRFDHLKSGKADWLSWASAVGTRMQKPAHRNHLLGYFKNGNPINRLIATAVMKF